MQKLLKRVLLLSCVFLVLFSLSANADSRADYDRYVAAYKNYQNAIVDKKSETEIQQLLREFKSAKAAYENESGKGKTSEVQQVVDQANTDDESASGLQVTSETDETDQVQAKKLPTTLRKIIQRLWSPKYRNSPDKNIRLLQSYINSEKDSEYADIARYELAKAYELLKKDTKSSGKVLADIAKRSPNSKIGKLASVRIQHLEAGAKCKQWKKSLNASFNVKTESYRKYQNTSWLAFPVKASRWIGYVRKLNKFDKNQKNFTKFQIWHEKVSARFVPPIEVSFDMFVTASGNASSTGEVELCYSNTQAWYARWKLLHEARHTIDIQYFIIEGDVFGMSLMGALLKKAKEGLKINLMIDSRGTKGFSKKLQGQDYMQELVQYPNVKVRVFDPFHTNLLTALGDVRRIMTSNHDKLFIIDNEYSIVGGRNISMNYFLDPADYPTSFRDCDVVIKSKEVAQDLKQAFSEEFGKLKNFKISKDIWGNIDIVSDPMNSAYQAMYSHLLNEVYKAPKDANSKFTKALKKNNEELAGYKHLSSYSGYELLNNSVFAPIKIIDKNSKNGPRNDLTDEMIKYIDGSKKEIILQNPYVVLTERVYNALQRAGKRGVSIIIHTNSPYSTDSLATQAMFYADWKKILAKINGCRIFVYHGERKLHAKNWLFDSKIGVVGTYNLDYMSEQINSEIVAAVKSVEFSKQLRDEMMKDIAQCKEYKISIDEKGNISSVIGPDDFKGKNFWLLKLMSKFTVIKKLI